MSFPNMLRHANTNAESISAVSAAFNSLMCLKDNYGTPKTFHLKKDLKVICKRTIQNNRESR